MFNMKNRLNQYRKYPPHLSRSSWYEWLEKLIIKTHFGGIARCSVCGSLALISAKGESLRETCFCTRCSSSNRQRQIAYVACQAIGFAQKKKLSSLKDFVLLDSFTIYNTETKGAIHALLSRTKNYICSEYFGDSHKSGEFVNNVMHQDLADISLGDQSVDLVISSEVFEHIPDPYRAHEEVYRILKKGGRHIFTVPFDQTEFLDDDRATMNSDKKTILLKEPIYHSDWIRPEGVLVYKIFSLEMLIELKKIGFRTNLYQLFKPSRGIWGVNAIVFEAIRE
jgi:SAM-dependent methyltransferase